MINSCLFSSKDGGFTWSKKFKPFSDVDVWQCLAFPSKNHIYMGGSSAWVWKSSDGGKTFDTVTIAYSVNPDYQSWLTIETICMADSLVGIAEVWMRGYITTDGWRTRRKIDHPWYSIYPLYCFDSLNYIVQFYVRGKDSARINGLGRTSDGGRTWHEFVFKDGESYIELYIEGIYFFDEVEGIAVGGRPTGVGNRMSSVVFRTTDGGFTWQKILDTNYYPFTMLSQIECDKETGKCLAVGYWGLVLFSSDKGKSWARVPFDESKYNTPRMDVARAGSNWIVANAGLWIFREVSSSSVMDTSSALHNKDISTYPNPFTESVTIQFNTEIEFPFEIEFYDSMGNLIEKRQFDYPVAEINFSPTDRSNGVYFYRIQTSEGTYTGSIIKLK